MKQKEALKSMGRWRRSRPAVPEEMEAVKRWSNPAPMLVLGSHDWNIPNDAGELKCGGALQRSIMRAASRRDLVPEAEAAHDRWVAFCMP